ncbi:hypothetical protein BGP_2917 [Beggiatoa sp. PS]|nr:hypothetical protein BGP_2917 [Beggiatoa sp. PS]
MLTFTPNYLGDIIIRMDNEEHEPEHISFLTRCLMERPGISLINLTFDRYQLSSMEQKANTIFYELINQMFIHQVQLGLAHGFQAYSFDFFRRLTDTANEIISTAERYYAPMKWGYDLAMLLAAGIHGIPIHIIQKKGNPRFRQKQKVDEQLKTLEIILRVVSFLKKPLDSQVILYT